MASPIPPRPDEEDTIANPLEAGRSELLRRQWVYDFNDDVFGGFACGEFLLRSDGVLFIRYGVGRTSPGSTSYKYSLWKVDQRWRGKSISGFIDWANGFPYGLSSPSPVPVDEFETGPSGEGEDYG
jgi:hypothetical protein